jgi:hypothetical protein
MHNEVALSKTTSQQAVVPLLSGNTLIAIHVRNVNINGTIKG